MGEDERSELRQYLMELKESVGSIAGRLEALVTASEKGDSVQQVCRAHCDAETGRIHARIDEVKTKIDRLWGVWALAVGVLLLVFKDLIKAVLM